MLYGEKFCVLIKCFFRYYNTRKYTLFKRHLLLEYTFLLF